MIPPVLQALAWRIIIVLSVVEAGAYLGVEAAQYFWDLWGYVLALDSEFPYRSTVSFPFLYPPFSVDLFTLARSHLFELLSISYVGAVALFIDAYARVPMARRVEWLFAITAMGGMGVVSLQTGNVALLMNFSLLAVALQAALGRPLYVQLLPIVIGFGALIKPQFALYLGLLPLVETSRRTAMIKIVAVAAAVVAVHGWYVVFRPSDWNEYVEGVIKRTLVERDFGWSPAALSTRFTTSPIAPHAAYAAGVLATAALCYAAWRRSASAGRQVPAVAIVMLVFVALTFANPRLPLYDLYAGGIALVICCGLSGAPSLAWVLAMVLAINAVPWSIAEFTRDPPAWPWWMHDQLITHLIGIGGLLIALSRVGFSNPEPNRT